MADKWLTFDCYGTIADWNTGMGGPLEKVAGRDTGRLLTAYHQAELELEAGPGWTPYREVLTAGLASAAGTKGSPWRRAARRRSSGPGQTCRSSRTRAPR